MIGKKILFLSISLKKGGAENQLIKLALFLEKQGYMVKIIYFVKGNDFSKELVKSNIKNEFINIKSISGIIKYKAAIRNYKPDLLISFMFAANIVARFTKLIFKTPLITSVRNNEISALYRLLYKLTYKVDTFTTFNSQYALDKFIQKKLTVKNKSFLLNNAIDIPKEISSRDSSEIFSLVSLAHFRPQKDYQTLFKAVKKIKDEGININLYVLGHLFNQNWPNKVLNELNIQDSVHLIGFTNNTSSYLKKADILVLSSLWEGTPNAILEGMSHKLPIIASNIPGNRELILNSKSGVLFDVGSSYDLAKKIKKLQGMTLNKRKNLGVKGYNYVIEKYQASKVHGKWLELIKKTLC